MKRICDRLKFVDSWCVDSVGKSGGLALFWRMGVDLDVVFSDKNMIVALVYSDPPDLGFIGPSFTWSNKREGLANIREIGSVFV